MQVSVKTSLSSPALDATTFSQLCHPIYGLWIICLCLLRPSREELKSRLMSEGINIFVPLITSMAFEVCVVYMWPSLDEGPGTNGSVRVGTTGGWVFLIHSFPKLICNWEPLTVCFLSTDVDWFRSLRLHTNHKGNKPFQWWPGSGMMYTSGTHPCTEMDCLAPLGDLSENLVWNCHQMNVPGPYRWYGNIGSGNDYQCSWKSSDKSDISDG